MLLFVCDADIWLPIRWVSCYTPSALGSEQASCFKECVVFLWTASACCTDSRQQQRSNDVTDTGEHPDVLSAVWEHRTMKIYGSLTGVLGFCWCGCERKDAVCPRLCSLCCSVGQWGSGGGAEPATSTDPSSTQSRHSDWQIQLWYFNWTILCL